MSRQMPLECEHGRIIDWGDFGEDRPPQECTLCDAIAKQAARGMLRHLRSGIESITNA